MFASRGISTGGVSTDFLLSILRVEHGSGKAVSCRSPFSLPSVVMLYTLVVVRLFPLSKKRSPAAFFSPINNVVAQKAVKGTPYR